MITTFATSQGGGERLRRPAVPVVLALAAALTLPSWCSAAGARQQSAVAGSLSPVAVTLTDLGDSTMRLDGRFTIAAGRDAVWSVLTDYDHLARFVSSMRASQVKARGEGFLLVEQESVAKMLLFHRTFDVLLRVREDPRRAITFADIGKTSFERYEGSWMLDDSPGGTEVTYRLTAKGRFIGFLTRGPAQGQVRELLEQVRAEIGRRAPARSGCCGNR